MSKLHKNVSLKSITEKIWTEQNFYAKSETFYQSSKQSLYQYWRGAGDEVFSRLFAEDGERDQWWRVHSKLLTSQVKMLGKCSSFQDDVSPLDEGKLNVKNVISWFALRVNVPWNTVGRSGLLVGMFWLKVQFTLLECCSILTVKSYAKVKSSKVKSSFLS